MNNFKDKCRNINNSINNVENNHKNNCMNNYENNFMNNRNNAGKYDDIINLPHHVSKTHKQMPIYDRAAQFAPFSALTGYEDVINETARLTDEFIEIDGYIKAEIDMKLQKIRENLKNRKAYVSDTNKLKSYEDDGNVNDLKGYEDIENTGDNKDNAGNNIRVTYFKPDSKKSGGKYLECRGNVKKLDEYNNRIIMEDNTEIDISGITDIEIIE